MEQKQLKGFSKFIALLVISALVISVIIFTASGNALTGDLTLEENKQNDTSPTPSIDQNIPTDSEINDTQPSDKNEKPDENMTSFKNILTGLEITESEYNSSAYGIVIDPSENIYGLSYADIAIEFPTEMGTSRMLFFSSDDEVIWKIGALMPTRKFITAMSAYFGGIVVALGEDDKISYSVENEGRLIDISKHSDCSYNESGDLHYTNEKLIEIALNRTQYISTNNGYSAPPYIVSEERIESGINIGNTVMIPYETDNVTQLVYDSSTDEYIYAKNTSSKADMLNGDKITFKNAFVLFADTTTYESSTAKELVIDTESGGSGYYFHNGKMTEIRWRSNGGKLVFTNLMGEILAVNKGTSYISFYKSSECTNITMH